MTAQRAKKLKAIPEAEWHAEVNLMLDGHVLASLELEYTDAYFAAEPVNVGYLIARAMEERSVNVRPRKRGRKTRHG
jgi:hypothetical protein